MTNKKSHTDKLLGFLSKNKKNPVTAKKIAATVRIPLDSVRKRVYDLRNEGYKIYTEQSTVRGKAVSTYRLAS